MLQVDYDGNELTIGDETITLRHRIEDIMKTEGKILVVLYPPNEVEDLQNVLAFDEDGNKLWESEVPEKKSQHLFAGLRKEDGDVIGWSWNAHDYKIDLETGELEDLGRVTK